MRPFPPVLRRPALFSAPPAPSLHLPDPDLSEIVRPLRIRFAEAALTNPTWRPPNARFRAVTSLHTFRGDRARTSRWMEPA